MNLSRYFFLSIYYGLARYLPSRDSKIGGGDRVVHVQPLCASFV